MKLPGVPPRFLHRLRRGRTRRAGRTLFPEHLSRPVFMLLAAVVAAGTLLVPAACGAAVPECQARVLQPVTDDMGHRWKKGSIVPVDIARSNLDGDRYCAHGGSCLPPAQSNGQQTIVLTNCKVGEALGNGDFRLVPDAQLAGTAAAAAMTKRADAENKLSALGFSNAAAGSLAEEFVTHPHSARGQLVGRALAGSPEALKKLQAQFP